jgi:high-affinity K+ transport system ATPase subunit B
MKNLIRYLNKKIKNLDSWDILFIKLGVVFFVLFVLGIWPFAKNWAFSINPCWFLVLLILCLIRPFIKYFF